MPILIIVTGSLAYDKICNFDGFFADHLLANKLESLSVVFTLKSCRTDFGGTAGNIAYNLTLLDERPYLISNAGDDFEIYKKHLEKLGVKKNLVEIFEHEKTAECTMINDLDNKQIGTFYDGALAHEVDLSKLDNLKTENAIAIVAPTNIASMIKAANYFSLHSIPYVFDPGQQIGNFTKADFINCLRSACLLIVNEYEWEIAKKNFLINKEYVLQYTNNLIVTLGAKGAVIFRKDNEINLPAFPVSHVVDVTSCGDAVRAGILYGIKNKWKLEDGCLLGLKLASKAIAQFGSQNHVLSIQEKNQFLN